MAQCFFPPPTPEELEDEARLESIYDIDPELQNHCWECGRETTNWCTISGCAECAIHACEFNSMWGTLDELTDIMNGEEGY